MFSTIISAVLFGGGDSHRGSAASLFLFFPSTREIAGKLKS